MAYEGPHPLPVPSGGTGAATLTGVLTGHGTSAITASTVTQHGVLLGGSSNTVSSTSVGSTGQVLQANTSSDPTYSTATYPVTTTANQILYSSSSNTITGLATANNGVLTTGISGIPAITALSSDGQLIIGSSAGSPTAATLTAGTGISISNGHNSITITNSSTGMSWVDNPGNITASVNTGYFISTTTTITLPASPSIGNTISFAEYGSSNITIQANTGQQIIIGPNTSSIAGTAADNGVSSLTLVYDASRWIATSIIGVWNLN